MGKARIPELLEKIKELDKKLDEAEMGWRRACNKLDIVRRLLDPVVRELDLNPLNPYDKK